MTTVLTTKGLMRIAYGGTLTRKPHKEYMRRRDFLKLVGLAALSGSLTGNNHEDTIDTIVPVRIPLEQTVEQSEPAQQRTATEEAKSEESRIEKYISEAPLIVIDAGHGGRYPGDPGACVKYEGKELVESELVLPYALALAEMLKKDGFKVRLTRKDDTNIPLLKRAKMAQDPNSVCLSIHADSSNPSVSGPIVMYEREDRLATTVPLADSIANELKRVYEKNSCVSSDNRGISRTVASCGRGELVMTRGVCERGEGPYAGIIVELGNLQNEKDRNLLLTKKEDLVNAIKRGIYAYAKQAYEKKEEKIVKKE